MTNRKRARLKRCPFCEEEMQKKDGVWKHGVYLLYAELPCILNGFEFKDTEANEEAWNERN